MFHDSTITVNMLSMLSLKIYSFVPPILNQAIWTEITNIKMSTLLSFVNSIKIDNGCPNPLNRRPSSVAISQDFFTFRLLLLYERQFTTTI